MKQLTVTKTLKTFYYKGELYIRLVPAKTLFHSTMVHQVVNRGDVFAMRMSDQALTIVPGKADVQHSQLDVTEPLTLPPAQQDMFPGPKPLPTHNGLPYIPDNKADEKAWF